MKTQLLFKSRLHKMAFFLLFAISFNSYAMPPFYGAIPDVNFETRLIALGLDSGPIDHLVLKSSVASVTSLNLNYSNIQDLTGIQFFISLTTFECYNNQLTNLDFTNNTALTYLLCNNNQLINLNLSNNNALTTLDCSFNQLINLNVSNNVNLIILYCGFNQISNLDVSNNVNLSYLCCDNNLLNNLDVSNNSALSSLFCNNNQLTNLNVSGCSNMNNLLCFYNQLTSLNIQNGNNQNFNLFNSVGNPNLTCIEVDNENYSNQYWQYKKDATASYSTDCSTFLATENNNIQNAKLYPNPTKGLLHIDNINLEQVKLYNALGEEVNEQKYLTSSINNTIDLSALATGIYFARFESNGKISTQKIIKE